MCGRFRPAIDEVAEVEDFILALDEDAEDEDLPSIQLRIRVDEDAEDAKDAGGKPRGVFSHILIADALAESEIWYDDNEG